MIQRLQSVAVALILLAAVLAVPFVVGLGIDNRLERWVSPGGEAASTYAAFRDTFGSDEFVVIAYGGTDLFAQENLDLQVRVLEALETIPEITRVSGIPQVYRDLFGLEDAEALAGEMREGLFYEGLLVNEDATVGGLFLETVPDDSRDGRVQLLRNLEDAVAPLRDVFPEVHLVGPPLLNAVLDETSAAESRRTFPLAFGLTVVLLYLCFRSFRLTLIATVCAGLTLLLTLGLAGFLHLPLNMITAVLPSLLWVLTLANITHILSAYQRERVAGSDVATGVTRALASTGRACVLAGVTTALGFLALRTADMPPVRELGLLACCGMIIGLVVNLTLGPTLLRLLRPGAPSLLKHPLTVPSGLARFPVARPWWVLVPAFLLLAVTIASLPFVRVESNPLSFFPEEATVREDYAYVSEHLTGFYSLETVITTNNAWTNPETLKVIDAAARRLEALPEVARVVSPVEVLKKIRQWDAGMDPAGYALPETEEEAVDLVVGADEASEAMIRRFVSEDGRSVRLASLVRVMDSSRFGRVVDQAHAEVAGLPDGATGYVTGIVLRLVNAQEDLVHTQVRSFGLAFAVVFGCLLLGLRSWGLLIASVFPNLLPVVSALAIMAWTGVALDAATVMIASVALGIAVDDTVHLLAAYRERRRRGENPDNAMTDTLHAVGPPMVITTLTAGLGFLVLLRSGFLPVAFFGVLTTVALATALLADLIVTPAIVVVAARWRKA